MSYESSWPKSSSSYLKNKGCLCSECPVTSSGRITQYVLEKWKRGYSVRSIVFVCLCEDERWKWQYTNPQHIHHYISKYPAQQLSDPRNKTMVLYHVPNENRAAGSFNMVSVWTSTPLIACHYYKEIVTALQKKIIEWRHRRYWLARPVSCSIIFIFASFLRVNTKRNGSKNSSDAHLPHPKKNPPPRGFSSHGWFSAKSISVCMFGLIVSSPNVFSANATTSYRQLAVQRTRDDSEYPIETCEKEPCSHWSSRMPCHRPHLASRKIIANRSALEWQWIDATKEICHKARSSWDRVVACPRGFAHPTSMKEF